MSRAASFRIERRRRRGAFGLDERRRPDPARVEAEIRAFLAVRLPEVLALPALAEPEHRGRTLVLLLARGHAAVLRIEPDPDTPSAVAVALAARCRGQGIPVAVLASVAEARAALRRFGVEPPPSPSILAFPGIVRRCRANRSS